MSYIDIAIRLIKEFEGCRLNAYLCPAGKWTIGYGSTYYVNGTPVKMGDKLRNMQEASDLLRVTVAQFDKDVRKLVTSVITDNQRGVLIDFAFNLGSDIDADFIAEGLGDSTLLKMVNKNPNDPNIPKEFLKWNKSKGVPMTGLTRRRKAEANLWFVK